MSRRILMAMAAAMLLAAGCNSQLSPEAQKMLDSGRASYQAGDDAATVGQMDQFLAANSRNTHADEGYYLRGLAKYRMKDYGGAKSDMSMVVDKTSNATFKGLALKALGDLAYDTGDVGLAEAMYRQSMTCLDDRKPPADEVRYRLGQVLQRLSRWAEADMQFSRLIYNFPDSPLSKRAGRVIHCTSWTVQVEALADKPKAERLSVQLNGQGVSAVVRPIMTDRGPMFAVQVGRFAGYDEALKALPAVKAVQADAYVTVTK